jgi:hypothetical protein
MLGRILLFTGAISVFSAVCPAPVTPTCPKGQVLNFFSDTTTLAKGPAQPDLGQASLVDFIHSAWMKSIPNSPAKWISDDKNTIVRTAEDNYRYFVKTVNLECTPTRVLLDIGADNSFFTSVNSVSTPASDPTERNFGSYKTYDLTSFFVAGENVISWRVRNMAGSSDYRGNPTGLIYNLRVTL